MSIRENAPAAVAPLDDLANWALDKIAPPLAAGLVIAIVGSFLLPRLNEAFKGRRENLNGNVQILVDELESLQTAASTYWLTRGRSGAAEAEIEFRLGKISGVLTSVSEDLWPGRPEIPSQLFATLAYEVVSETFGDPKRKPQIDRGRSIAAVGGLLTAELLNRRRRYFHTGETSRMAQRAWWRTARRVASGVGAVGRGAKKLISQAKS